MAAAFFWHGRAGREAADDREGRDDREGPEEREAPEGRAGRPRHLGFAGREYLLAVAALLLLLSRLTDFVFVDWGSLRPAEDQTLSEAVLQGIVFLAILLRLPVLFGAATLAFWTSARQAGWTPDRLLNWRLPLVLAWLIALIAAASFVGWYGFLAVVPATAHYAWMLGRSRRRGPEREPRRGRAAPPDVG